MLQSKTLQIALYFDELEVSNPLGSRRGKHKLGVFYWTLLNIPPQHRSSLRNIYLLAVVNANHLKLYGFNKVMKQPVEDLKKLATEGVSIDSHNTYRGCVIAFLGDTPAAAMAGGFKEGVGGAYRCCRTCMIKRSDIANKLVTSELRLRNRNKHLEHCDLVEASGLENFFSKEYGINRRSILGELPFFDLIICLPHDIMHVIFEGVLPRHMKLLLSHYIFVTKTLSLSDLNSAIINIEYSKNEKLNKPRIIERDKLAGGDKLCQSASQMWLLGRFLPLMIGKYIPKGDKHWVCYINLLRIMSIAASQSVKQETSEILRMIIEDYLHLYEQLYPNNLTPKFHYLLHLAQQMKLLGPLRHPWCMRFEAKNHQIKKLVKQNFKNIPKTVAEHHQHSLTLELLTTSDYLHSFDIIGNVKQKSLTSFSKPIVQLFQQEQLEDCTGKNLDIPTSLFGMVIPYIFL